MYKNELLIFPSDLSISAFLPISVNGNSKAKPSETSIDSSPSSFLYFSQLSASSQHTLPVGNACRLIYYWRIVPILQTGILLNWNPLKPPRVQLLLRTLPSCCFHHRHPTVDSQHSSQKTPEETLSHAITFKPSSGFPTSLTIKTQVLTIYHSKVLHHLVSCYLPSSPTTFSGVTVVATRTSLGFLNQPAMCRLQPAELNPTASFHRIKQCRKHACVD